MTKKRISLCLLIIITIGILQGSCITVATSSLDETGYLAGGLLALGQEYAAGYRLYAENQNYQLWADPEMAAFTVVDREGIAWHSRPQDYMDDPIAQDVVKQAMASLIHIVYADRLGNLSSINCLTSSIEKGGLRVSPIEDGLRMDFVFGREGFEIPVEIKLFDEGLDLSLLTSEIKENKEEYSLVRLALNPYFGAADQEAEGYIFIPDGSGALIDLDVDHGHKDTYSQYVYGRDPSAASPDRKTQVQQVMMPVFGMKNGDWAYLAVITEGEARASINASTAGLRSSYSNVYAEFVYRDLTTSQIEGKIQTIRILEQTPINPDRYGLRYYFLKDDEADYTGMAHKYRDYLIRERGLEKAEDNFSSLFLDIYGGVTAKVYDWGIPINKVIPLTSYQDVMDILGQLQEQDIGDIVIDYRLWNKGANRSAITRDIRAEKRLGGKRDFKELLSYASNKGYHMFLDLNLTDIRKNSWQYNRLFHSASSVKKSPVIESSFQLHSLQDDMRYTNFLLKPAKLLELVDSFTGEQVDYPKAGFAPLSLGSKLYSDFGSVSRCESQQIWTQALGDLKESNNKLLLSSPNAYAFNYASFIADAPIGSSGFLLELYEVPFYQIVLRGLVPMSVPALNTMSNPRLGLLKAIETGSSIKYQWTAQNEDILVDTQLSGLEASNYRVWIDQAVADYKELLQVLELVGDSRIVGHERIHESLTRTEFENGTTVLVNYGDKEVEYQGINIGSESYYVSRAD